VIHSTVNLDSKQKYYINFALVQHTATSYKLVYLSHSRLRTSITTINHRLPGAARFSQVNWLPILDMVGQANESDHPIFWRVCQLRRNILLNCSCENNSTLHRVPVMNKCEVISICDVAVTDCTYTAVFAHPSVQTRHWSHILRTGLRFSHDCRLYSLYYRQTARRVWTILCDSSSSD